MFLLPSSISFSTSYLQLRLSHTFGFVTMRYSSFIIHGLVSWPGLLSPPGRRCKASSRINAHMTWHTDTPAHTRARTNVYNYNLGIYTTTTCVFVMQYVYLASNLRRLLGRDAMLIIDNNWRESIMIRGSNRMAEKTGRKSFRLDCWRPAFPRFFTFMVREVECGRSKVCWEFRWDPVRSW